ncbi:MAG: pectin esterase [Muribaculaceae bacterium]|nr:pectin esterase [Muribaculaceae bacterium]
MKLRITAFLLLFVTTLSGLSAAEWKRNIYVNQDGTGDCKTITEALEMIRAYMDYTVTVHIANGVYKEKIVIPAWLHNVKFIGENMDSTIITYNHHANIDKMGTFRTYTMKVDACDATFENLTIENDAPRLGQAVALHTEGDRLIFRHCRFLGNQDTIFTAGNFSRVYFEDCYIEGTTDFIFGPATAYFKNCEIVGKANSFITAASTPKDVKYGYIFDGCKIKALDEVEKLYLGRPWRPYAYTVFIDCELPAQIVAEGWNNWSDPANELTSRYGEYGSTGPGANPAARVSWARQLTPEEVTEIRNLSNVFAVGSDWNPQE